MWEEVCGRRDDVWASWMSSLNHSIRDRCSKVPQFSSHPPRILLSFLEVLLATPEKEKGKVTRAPPVVSKGEDFGLP